MTGGDDKYLRALQSGRLHRFGNYDPNDVPATGTGVYTIWDDNGHLVYVGIAGRSATGKGLRGRLRSHANGRRSGDQFCVYVGDRYVLLELSRTARIAVAAGQLSMDEKIRDTIREHFSFRFVQTPDYRAAWDLETEIKHGALGQRPDLNP